MSLYTSGNWTVDTMIVPSSDADITPAVTCVTRDEYSAKSVNGNEAVLVNSTGTSLSVSEQLRFGATSVANVYNGSGIAPASQLPVKTGVRLLQEIRLGLKASNNVSGAEVVIPQRAWIVYETPQSDIVTKEAIEYTMKRLLGAALMGVDGHTFADRIMAMARGDLDSSNSH